MSIKTAKILAIETSCDETGIAVVTHESGQNPRVTAAKVSSQVDVHALTGGVIPEVAAREHTEIIMPLIKDVLAESRVQAADLDAMAVTVGPGLMPALAVGVAAAAALSYAWSKPIVPVHHLEGHIYSSLLEGEPEYPALALVVSGGHTLLINVPGPLIYQIIGTTRDDAAGEAFDKVARLLGLPYPGGPALSKLALDGNAKAFQFSRPMLTSGDFDFSFSGLKTDVLYTLRDLKAKQADFKPADVAASFQQAVVDVLVSKTKSAILKHQPKVLLVAGGVAANTELRRQITAMADSNSVEARISPLAMCGDNASMIGLVGAYAFEAGRRTSWQEIDARARVSIEEFSV